MKKAAKGQRRLSFWNKYLALVISMLFFLNATAQDKYVDSLARVDTSRKYSDVNGDGFNWKGGRFVSILRAPHGLPNLSRKDSGSIAWYRNQYWQFDNTGHWDTLRSTGGSGGSAGSPTKIYVTGSILKVDTTSNPGYQTLGTNQLDGLKSGGLVTGAGGLSVGVTQADYVKNGIEYIAPANALTAVADPSLPRKYIVAVDTNGVSLLIPGTPSASPIEPQINPASQIRITSFDVPAGATSLNINTIVIYDENTEYTVTTSGTITLNANSTANPFHLTKSIFVSAWGDGAKIIFTKVSGTDTAFNNSVAKFFLWLNGAMGSNHFSLQFLNGSTTISNDVLLDPYLSPLDSGAYQPVVIPAYAMGVTGGGILNKVVFTLHGSDLSGAKGLYLDWLQLQTGINNPSIDYSNKVDSTTTLKINDSTYVNLYWSKNIYYQKGDTIKIHAGGGGGGSGTVTSVTGTSPINSSGGATPVISITTADATHIGALSSTDWNTFNGKLSSNQPITVTATGDATGTSSSSGTAPSLPLTLATVNSNVGTFTNATVTTNGKGLITGISNGSGGATPNLLNVSRVGNTIDSLNLLPQTNATPNPPTGNVLFDSAGINYRSSTGLTINLTKVLLTGNRRDSFPDKSGTFALLSDILSAQVTSEQEVTAASTSVTFTSVPATYSDYQIFRNGVLNESTTDYTTSGNIVTGSAWVVGDRIVLRRIK